MDSSFREQGTGPQQAPKSFFAAGLPILASLINWLAGLIKLTEEEREDAGIYLDRPGGEEISVSPAYTILYTNRNQRS